MGRISSFLGMTLASLWLACAPAIAQTSVIATPLPQPKSTFLDANGHPVVGAQIFHYVPNTTTKKTTWSDTGETNPNTNPVVTDAAGRATIFGQGNYDQKFVLPNGNVQWSSFTTAVGSAQPTGSSGTDTAPVGSLMPFSGFSVPTNWQLAYGQAISRASFPELLAALTISSPSVSCTSSSTSLSGWTSTSAMAIGQPVEASCIPTGATIASISNSTTIVISAVATASATVAAKVFPWGNGDGSLTFNVPDMRGRVPVGPDCQGGTCATRLSSTYYGALANVPAISGGSQSSTLAQTNLPAVNFVNSGITANFNSASILLPIHSSTISSSNGSQAAQGVQGPEADLAADSGTVAVSITAQGTAASGGSGTPTSRIQPSLTTNYIVKVTPNSSGAGGVVSLGGMFGDIVCDATMNCAPVASVNTIGCKTATVLQVGCVKPDGSSIAIAGDGTISTTGTFTPQTPVVLVTSGGNLSSSVCGTIVQLSGSAYYTVNVTAVAGYLNPCSFTIRNVDSVRFKFVTAFGWSDPSGLPGIYLGPGQSTTLVSNGVAWQVSLPGMWQAYGGDVNLYMDPSSSNGDNWGVTDGLAPSAPFKTAEAAFLWAQKLWCWSSTPQTRLIINFVANHNDTNGLHIPVHDICGAQGGAAVRFNGATQSITGAANNGSGAIRIAMASTSGYGTGTYISLYGVVGTTEANGTWQITVIDGTHLDLVNSTFSNAYASGGTITNGSGFATVGDVAAGFFGTVVEFSNLQFFSSAGNCVYPSIHSHVYMLQGNILWCPAGSGAIASTGGTVEIQNDIGVVQLAQLFLTTTGGIINADVGINVNFAKSFAWTTAGIYAATGIINVGAVGFNTNGYTITGKRWQADYGGQILGSTTPDSTYPGNSNGSSSYGGNGGNAAGVSCSGSPSGSFAAIGGYVTHC